MPASSLNARTAPLGRVFAVVAAAAVAGAIAGGAIGLALSGGNSSNEETVLTTAPTAAAEPSGAPGAALSPEEIYRSSSPGVVVITDTQVTSVPATPFTPPVQQQVSTLGSGFVLDRQGDVVTNDHVVRGARNIRVGFGGGATYPARIVGADPSSDLAVVRVDAPVGLLHPLVLGDSMRAEVGDPVYAIGNPFGLDRTMTAGIVSATGRGIWAPNGLTIPNVLQTDAPINHGNSGGPLLDRFGRVVGVNAQIEGGTIDANVGIWFAIPSETARSVVRRLIATGHAQHAWLGVEIETIDPNVAKAAGTLPEHGVIVVRVVAGSPAAKAGLLPARRQLTSAGASAFVGGDTIVGVDATRVTTSAELSATLARHEPGDTIALEVARGRSSRVVRVTLGDAPK